MAGGCRRWCKLNFGGFPASIVGKAVTVRRSLAIWTNFGEINSNLP